jgi:hypothetical protein
MCMGLRLGNHWKVLGIDGRMILQLILKKQLRWVCAGFMLLRIGMSGIYCDHSNEHLS